MTTTRLGTAGALWALAYVPIHVFWALGGATAAFGITDPGPHWALANWAACVIIAGAGLLCLALTRHWGTALPYALRCRGAQAAGVLALAHWAVFTATVLVTGPDPWGWWNLVVFEPWFGVMGALLLVCARRTRAGDAAASRGGTATTLAGVVITVVGVVAFVPCVFLGVGPVVTLIGVGVLRHTCGRPGSGPWSDAVDPVAAGR